MSLTAWLIAILIVLLGSILQSTTGFGLGLVTAPVLVLIDPTLVPTVILGIAVPLALLMVVRERHEFDIHAAKWALTGRLIGAAAGSWAVVVLGSRELSIAFALSLLVAVAVSASGFKGGGGSTGVMATAGFLSGVMGTVTSIGGPMMALALQHETGPRLRTMMASFLAFGGLLSLILLAIVGEFRPREMALAAILAPITLIGLFVSRWTVKILDQGAVRPAILAFASIAAVLILGRTL
ncbi:MAG: sulfite exporter TauE/SafE family protein [Actinomycetia bacterium]|nr:sulfite exporter TauE/SafE family protein [Actinomycetes bacterium]